MRDDGEVDVGVLDPLHQHRRRLAHHRDLDARVGLREARQDLGQVALGIVVGQAEPDAAGQFGLGEARQRLVERRTIRRA